MLYFLWFIMGGVIATSVTIIIKCRFYHKRWNIIIIAVNVVLFSLLVQFNQYKVDKLFHLDKRLEIVNQEDTIIYEKYGINAQTFGILVEIGETNEDSNLSREEMEKKISELESRISDVENIQIVEKEIRKLISEYKAESKKDVWIGAMLSAITGGIIPIVVGFKDEIKEAIKDKKRKKQHITKRHK